MNQPYCEGIAGTECTSPVAGAKLRARSVPSVIISRSLAKMEKSARGTRCNDVRRVRSGRGSHPAFDSTEECVCSIISRMCMFDCLSDQMKRDAHLETSTNERVVRRLLTAILSIVVFGGTYLAIHLL